MGVGKRIYEARVVAVAHEETLRDDVRFYGRRRGVTKPTYGHRENLTCNGEGSPQPKSIYIYIQVYKYRCNIYRSIYIHVYIYICIYRSIYTNLYTSFTRHHTDITMLDVTRSSAIISKKGSVLALRIVAPIKQTGLQMAKCYNARTDP